MKKYDHIFFDLDHTLWDFNRNSSETLSELFTIYKLESLQKFTLESFLKVYKGVNERLWDQYRKNLISKEYLRNGRFYETLCMLNHEDEILSAQLSDTYIVKSPYKGLLFPYAHETLSYLQTRYELHIITNGFSEVQRIKMNSSGLDRYFANVFISEEVGSQKPDAGIFNHALLTCKGSAGRSLMVGDNIETDLKGAAGVGMDHVFFNPEELEHSYLDSLYEISCLSRLMVIL